MNIEFFYSHRPMRAHCVDKNLYDALGRQGKSDEKDGDWIEFTWVDYILTTANTWKTPIHDFQLIVERPKGRFVSFCWDGPIQKLDADHFLVKQNDFVPTKEMHVGFFQY